MTDDTTTQQGQNPKIHYTENKRLNNTSPLPWNAGRIRCFRRVSVSCSTSRVNYPISNERRNMDGIMFIQYPASTRKSVEITKVVIRIRKSKDRQYNDQKKKDKQRSTKHTHKTKDRVTRSVVIYRSLSVLSMFAFALSVLLRFPASYYPFGIFKLSYYKTAVHSYH
jgi:cation transport ATPase